ncbi:MAG: Hint domain-containing protein [Rhodobacteraceae bacterium]|nr:Hint domain-containing protein [Paracoccaceae bacterium]
MPNDMSYNALGRIAVDAYPLRDFRVVSGANQGEGLDPWGAPCAGDIYVLSRRAEAERLPVPVGGADLAELLPARLRLTFLGTDTSRLEVAVLDPARAPEAASVFVPLSPIVTGLEYTLISIAEARAAIPGPAHGSPCFTRGTRIRMADGSLCPVEDIAPGDLVETLDNGPRPVRWAGRRAVRAEGHLAPVVFSAGSIGNPRELIVSPEHRLMLRDWRAEVMLGEPEVLIRARDMVNGDTIYRRSGGSVDYVHILFDDHQIVWAEDVPSESLHLEEGTLSGLAPEARDEILTLFPELARRQARPEARRMSLEAHEARTLLREVMPR